MSINSDRSSPFIYAPQRPHPQYSNVRLGRGPYNSEEESRLLGSLSEGFRARLLYSESGSRSSRSSDRVAVDIFNVQLEQLRVQAGTPSPVQPLIPDIFGEDQAWSSLKDQEVKVDAQKIVTRSEQSSAGGRKQKLEQLRKEADEYLAQTEWMFMAPKSAVASLKKF